jgi:hypothetical protein
MAVGINSASAFLSALTRSTPVRSRSWPASPFDDIAVRYTIAWKVDAQYPGKGLTPFLLSVVTGTHGSGEKMLVPHV